MKVVLIVAGTVLLAFGVVVNPALFGGLLPFVLVGGALFAPMFLSRRRATEEHGCVPLFETTCSGSFGWLIRTNLQSIRLSVYNDFLVIAYFSPTVIPFSDIRNAEVLNILLGHRLLLQTKSGASYRLWLSAKIPEKVLKLLHA